MQQSFVFFEHVLEFLTDIDFRYSHDFLQLVLIFSQLFLCHCLIQHIILCSFNFWINLRTKRIKTRIKDLQTIIYTQGSCYLNRSFSLDLIPTYKQNINLIILFQDFSQIFSSLISYLVLTTYQTIITDIITLGSRNELKNC